MKKIFWGTVLLALAIVFPIPTIAEVDISIGISLPPPIVFGAPPEVVVIPDTNNVYVVPDLDVDFFFWNGWWWRLWDGRWYRSHYYNRGWAYYRNVPSFYFDVDPGWRGYYRDHHWYGHRWNYERIPSRRLQQNWKSWNSNRYWERQRTWGVQSYQPRPQPQRQELRHKRQEQYQQRPEVQRHQQKMQQQRRPQVQQPQRQRQQPQQERQPQVQQPQRQQQHPQQERQPQVQQPQGQQQPPRQQQSQPRGEQRQRESQRPQPQEKPDRGDEDHRR